MRNRERARSWGRRLVQFDGPLSVIPPAFSPIDLPHLDQWFVAGPTWCFADSGATIPCHDGDPVYTWLDRSGGGRNAVQATEAYRPKLVNDGTRWVVRFDGIDDLMVPSFTATTGTDHAVYVSYRPAAVGAYNAVFEGPSWRMYESLSGGHWGTYTGGDAPSGTALANGTRYQLGMNGGVFRTSGVTDGNYTAPVSGGAIGGEGTPFRNVTGDIDQIVTCTAPLGDADRDALESYMLA